MKWDWIWLVLAVGLAVAGVAYFNANQVEDSGENLNPVVVAKRSASCRSLKGTPEERFDACMGEVAPVTLSKNASKAIAELVKSRTAFTVGRVQGYEGADLLGQNTDVRSALLGTNESKVAKVLRGKGFELLMVHRDLVEALDRDNVVAARLAHHDFLEWFQLRYVTPDMLVYSVRANPARVPTSTGDSMLKGLRARLGGAPIPRQTWTPSAVRLIGTLRLQGETLVMRHAVGKNLESVLNELATKLIRTWEREVEVKGIGALPDRLDDVRIEIQVVMERAPVEPRDRGALFELFEMGVDGAIFQHREGVKDLKFSYMPGSELTTHSWHNVDEMLQNMAKQGGWRDRRPWEDPTTRLDMIRTQHFMESEVGGGPAVKLARGMPIVTMESLTDNKIRQMLVNGGEWWLENLKPDDSFEYKYWPTQNRSSDDYNEVRHILAARDLADAWRYRHDPRYLAGSQRAMDWLMKYAVYGDDPVDPRAPVPHPPAGTMLFRYPSVAEQLNKLTKKEPNQKLGTVAVALLGWLAWADATGDHSQDDNIRKMAKYVASQQTPEGKFEAYNVPRTHSYYGNKNDIVPGEAALALGQVAEYFDEPEWLEFFPKFLDFYTPWFRSRAVRQNPYGRWPHNTYSDSDRLDLVQFGPWSVMASKQYYKLTGDTRAADFGLEVSDWMIDNYQWSGARSPWPDFVGGYYKLPQELPAMQTFCYSEGTAAAYTIASKHRPDQKDKYDIATREAIRFLDVMQFDGLDSYFLARPKKVFGGIKYTMNENKVRIDYVGHGLSTLSQYLDAREYDPQVTLNVPDPAILDPIAQIPGGGGALSADDGDSDPEIEDSE
ncbi:MAG: hypothetical protein R3F61_12210 [Myxococcota bacterium]